MSIDQKYIQLAIESNFGKFEYQINNVIALQPNVYQVFFTLNKFGYFINQFLVIKINPESCIHLKRSINNSNIDQPVATNKLGAKYSDPSTENPTVTSITIKDGDIILIGNNLDKLTIQDFNFFQGIFDISDINQLEITNQSKTIIVLSSKNNSRLMVPSRTKVTYDVPDNISLRLVRPNAKIATIGIQLSKYGEYELPLTFTLLGSNLSEVTPDDLAFLGQNPNDLNFQYMDSNDVKSIKFTITDLVSFKNAFKYDKNTIIIPNELELSFIKS